MSARIIKLKAWYSTVLCRAYPDVVFVFGDNTLGFGKGGQAIIRDEPNAYGIPTKWKPARSESSFFACGDEKAIDAVLHHLGGLWHELEEGRAVVIPVNSFGMISLGLDRAELLARAPDIYALIGQHISEMSAAYGEYNAETIDDLSSTV